jgi:hypothetical protein
MATLKRPVTAEAAEAEQPPTTEGPQPSIDLEQSRLKKKRLDVETPLVAAVPGRTENTVASVTTDYGSIATIKSKFRYLQPSSVYQGVDDGEGIDDGEGQGVDDGEGCDDGKGQGIDDGEGQGVDDGEGCDDGRISLI